MRSPFLILFSLLLLAAPSFAQPAAPAGEAKPAKPARQGKKVTNKNVTAVEPVPQPTPSKAPEEEQKPGIMPDLRAGFAKSPEAGKYAHVCESIRIENRDDFEFTDMETRLICGDTTNDKIGTPWRQIPPNEAAYFLRSFLQSRGYHQPEFVQDGNTLFVKTGPMARLKNFTVRGGPPSWDPPKRRLIRGNPMTPGLLNDLQGWSLSQIKNEGYACAEAEAQGDPITSEAAVIISPGEQKYFGPLENSGDSGLRDGVLDRYNAFHRGELYREYLIALTRRRTQEDGFLQTLVLTTRCGPEREVPITRDVVLGPSNSIRIGAGGSTDEGARLRAIIRQSRMGSSASSAEARLNLSYLDEETNRQIANANFRWFYSRASERSYIEPSIIFEHARKPTYETQALGAKIMHGWNKEFTDGQLELRAGPSFIAEDQTFGTGPASTSVLFADTNLRYTTHLHEFWATSPREGLTLDLNALAAQEGIGSKFTAQRLQLNGQKLWDIFHFDPPLLVLGLRWELSSVFSPDPNIGDVLPKRFVSFLGGDSDLRGFRSDTLPRSGKGALSSAALGFEARLHKVIFRRVDFFTFLDSGVLGGASFALRAPFLMSPGLGLRWESPVGVLRGYAAQRFALNEPVGEPEYGREWRFGFTFGEEF